MDMIAPIELAPQPRKRKALQVLAAGALGVGLAGLAGLGLWWSEWRAVQPASAPPIASLPATPQDIARKAVQGLGENRLPEDRARALNAAVAFRPLGEAARPFRFGGRERDRERARDCLATAMLYEAGDDAEGQESVAQVVLNRVRHPAYPATVCGVVYQGATLRTGCQFTFTCDGSLMRSWSEPAWARARKLAEQFLDGRILRKVGLATHYHTDWVHPYWSDSLEKIAQVRTHLFFRWPGWWGTRRAFGRTYAGGEPDSMALRRVAREQSAAAETGLASIEAEAADGELLPIDLRAIPRTLADLPTPGGIPAAALSGNRLVLTHPDGGAFGLLLKSQATAQELTSVALRLCQTERVCAVMGWSAEENVARGFPIGPAERAKLTFEYRRDAANHSDRLLFDCTVYPRDNPEQCR